MDGEEAAQAADPNQPEEEKEQQQPAEVQVVETRSEWDTDLEPDSRSQKQRCRLLLQLISCISSLLIHPSSDNKQPHLSRAELYQEACQHTKAVPVKSFLRSLENTHMNLNHYGLGPLGARALAIALRVGRASHHTSKA